MTKCPEWVDGHNVAPSRVTNVILLCFALPLLCNHALRFMCPINLNHTNLSWGPRHRWRRWWWWGRVSLALLASSLQLTYTEKFWVQWIWIEGMIDSEVQHTNTLSFTLWGCDLCGARHKSTCGTLGPCSRQKSKSIKLQYLFLEKTGTRLTSRVDKKGISSPCEPPRPTEHILHPQGMLPVPVGLRFQHPPKSWPWRSIL